MIYQKAKKAEEMRKRNMKRKRMHKDVKRILFDMDGVLCIFDDTKSIEEIATPGFFRTRKPDPAAVATLNMLYHMANFSEDMDLYIMSSVFNDDHSANDKLMWITDKFAWMSDAHVIFSEYGKPKASAVPDGWNMSETVLVDDFTRNLREWRSEGGVGIKYLNGINGTKGTWDGFIVSNRMKPELMARTIKAIADMLPLQSHTITETEVF